MASLCQIVVLGQVTELITQGHQAADIVLKGSQGVWTGHFELYLACVDGIQHLALEEKRKVSKNVIQRWQRFTLRCFIKRLERTGQA